MMLLPASYDGTFKILVKTQDSSAEMMPASTMLYNIPDSVSIRQATGLGIPIYYFGLL